MSRRASREVAMKLLYQLEIQKDNREEQIENSLNESMLDKSGKEYVADIINGVYKNVEHIDSIINDQLKGWKINRISKVDLSILRLSIFEICYRD